MMTNMTISALDLVAVAKEEGGGRKDGEMRGGGKAASVVTVLLDHKLS